MKKPCNSIAASALLLISAFVFSLPAHADPQNVLDSIVVTGEDFSIASSDGATFTQQFGNANANLIDCEATSDGIFCINIGDDGSGNDVYEIVELSVFGSSIYTCEEVGFEGKGKRPAQCSALAVEDESTLYIAGILNRNGSAIFNCTNPPTPAPDDCQLVIQDRPPIIDLDRVPEGLLYVEDRNTVVLLTGIEPAGAPTLVTVADDKDLDLFKQGKDKEEILDVAQIVDASGGVRYAVTTSFGRLIAFKSALGVVDESSIIEFCLLGLNNCGASGQASYDVTQNFERGGPIYALVSDTGGGTGAVLVFSNDLSNGFDQESTIATTVDSDPFNGLFLSAFEGQNVNFEDCDPDCPVGNFADLSFNPLEGTATTGTAWEITGIPQCAWVDESVDVANTCVAEAEVADCVAGGTGVQQCLCEANVLRVVGPLVGGEPTPTIAECAAAAPGLLEFNVSEVLPPNLIAEFDVDPFPDLWMPPDFQAQPINGHFFTGILMDAGNAQSSELPELVVEDIPGSYACPGTEQSPLQSSMVLRQRERAATCDASTGVCNESIGSAITYACTSTRSRSCCSLFPLDTMLAQRPGARTAAGEWYVDDQGIDTLSDGTKIDDSAAGKFVDSHFEALEDFEYAACNDVDNDGQAALDSSTCDQLEQRRLNAREKLINALSNTADGTNCSQSSRNYQSFVTQIANYIAEAESDEGYAAACSDGIDNDGDGLIDGADGDCNPPAGDPAARVQALIAHASVLPYAVNEILLPTISEVCEDGWLEFNTDWIFD